MHSDRWKQIDNLLQAVLERPARERVGSMRDDEALQREVRSLLNSQQEAGSFLGRSPGERSPAIVAPFGGQGQVQPGIRARMFF